MALHGVDPAGLPSLEQVPWRVRGRPGAGALWQNVHGRSGFLRALGNGVRGLSGPLCSDGSIQRGR